MRECRRKIPNYLNSLCQTDFTLPQLRCERSESELSGVGFHFTPCNTRESQPALPKNSARRVVFDPPFAARGRVNLVATHEKHPKTL